MKKYRKEISEIREVRRDKVTYNTNKEKKKKNINEEIRKIKNINPKAFILRVNNKYILNSKLKEARVLDNGYLKKLKVKMMNSKKI